ncbi:MAG TPA: hypothetical protein VI451_14390 [Anaerolineales bacterium]|nr:hypothetical protein [Anaerolineales bacterium]
MNSLAGADEEKVRIGKKQVVFRGLTDLLDWPAWGGLALTFSSYALISDKNGGGLALQVADDRPDKGVTGTDPRDHPLPVHLGHFRIHGLPGDFGVLDVLAIGIFDRYRE